MENLDDLKKKLEIERLKVELKTERFFPSKKLVTWQAIAPSLLTLISIIITGLILLNLNVFETNSKLLVIQRDSLKKEIAIFEITRGSLLKRVDKLTTDSTDLANKIEIYKSVFEKTNGSMNDQQRIIAELTTENKKLAAGQGKYDYLVKENNMLLEQIGNFKLNAAHLITDWGYLETALAKKDPLDEHIRNIRSIVQDINGWVSRN